MVRGRSPRALQKQVALLAEVPGHLFVDVVEERLEARRRRRLGPRHGLPKTRVDGRAGARLRCCAPKPTLREVTPHALDGVACRPRFDRLALTVSIRIVARRVTAHPIGDGLDERRPLAPLAALDGLPGGRNDREEVVAVDANARDA